MMYQSGPLADCIVKIKSLSFGGRDIRQYILDGIPTIGVFDKEPFVIEVTNETGCYCYIRALLEDVCLTDFELGGFVQIGADQTLTLKHPQFPLSNLTFNNSNNKPCVFNKIDGLLTIEWSDQMFSHFHPAYCKMINIKYLWWDQLYNKLNNQIQRLI